MTNAATQFSIICKAKSKETNEWIYGVPFKSEGFYDISASKPCKIDSQTLCFRSAKRDISETWIYSGDVIVYKQWQTTKPIRGLVVYNGTEFIIVDPVSKSKATSLSAIPHTNIMILDNSIDSPHLLKMETIIYHIETQPAGQDTIQSGNFYSENGVSILNTARNYFSDITKDLSKYNHPVTVSLIEERKCGDDVISNTIIAQYTEQN